MVGLAIGIYFAISLGKLLLDRYRINQQAEDLRQEIQLLKTENEELGKQLAYLKSDEALEKMARQELGWAKPGETRVIIVDETGEQPVASLPSSTKVKTKAEDISFWQQWWNRFFGARK